MAGLPNVIWLWVEGKDDDVVGETERRPWETNWTAGPSSNSVWDGNSAKGQFDLAKLEDNARLGFTLRSIDGGVLMYEVHGEIEVIRN
jgi:hypothetical protein